VYVRDPDRQTRGPLPVTGGEVVLRANHYGSWWLEMDAGHAKAGRVVPGGGILVRDDDTGESLWSGRFTRLERVADAATPKRVLRMSGVTDEAVPFYRINLPDPSRPDTEQNLAATAHYTASGVAETVARALVDTQVGPGAIVARRAAGLVLETAPVSPAGATVSVSARYSNPPTVGDLLHEVATVGGITWRIVQVGVTREFRVSTPRDLSTRARFSRALRNVGGFSSSDAAPDVTDVTVLAQGEGVARTIRHRSASTVWGERIEAALDRRDTDDNTTLDQAGDVHLAENGPAATVEFDPVDLPRMAFFTDYFVNDLVTVETDWGTVTDRVRQVTGTLTPHGWRWKPLIGPAAARDPGEPVSVRLVKQAIRRIGRLEGSQ
jgi:hypothetical protein